MTHTVVSQDNTPWSLSQTNYTAGLPLLHLSFVRTLKWVIITAEEAYHNEHIVI